MKITKAEEYQQWKLVKMLISEKKNYTGRRKNNESCDLATYYHSLRISSKNSKMEIQCTAAYPAWGQLV